jgi:3-hydroxyacyl-CoA dehydrogenase/enoyl-CoA hydratase/3-hydroxybutyryl-CoA epimerase
MQSAVRYDKDADNIVTLTLDDPSSSANTMNEAYKVGMLSALERLDSEIAAGSVAGVVITSAKKTFFAGGNLKTMLELTPDMAGVAFEQAELVKKGLRRTETLGVPVVAAINGTALGGGLEITLATHHRIAVDDNKIDLGLPEVTLGLLPGGGGVTRMVRKVGLIAALLDWLTSGAKYKPAAAKEKGVIDELVATQEELVPAAKAWILANKDNPDAAVQPWDRKGFKLPGGDLKSPALAGFLPALPANLRKQLKGVDMPAPKAILATAVEGAAVDFDTASRIESRYFASLVTGQTAKNMIQAFFFDLQALNSGSLRPEGVEKFTATKLAVLGAGMMGAGIAYAAARAGIDVVLKDVSLESAEKGKAYSQKLLDKAVDRGRMTAEKRDEILGRITATDNVDDLAGCDSVIEAVFEDPALKQKLFAEIQNVVNADALLGSNTSTLPITELAQGVDRPEDFIGIHFFSPVDKMPIVEIIKGEKTSSETLARTIDLVLQLRKTPIVVNDSRGFYTSRVIGTMVNEGIAMVGEGVHPISIERAATQAGYPVGVLQLTDELNMELMAKIHKANEEAAARDGIDYNPHAGTKVVAAMLEAGRPGRLRGAGFYEYADGKRTGLWDGLAGLFPPAAEPASLQDLKDRLMFIEALETAKCFEEGVIESAAAANIGSIMAIGFPAVSGGTVQFMQGYPGGLAGFVERARELAATYGPRFEPPALLVSKAENGESF